MNERKNIIPILMEQDFSVRLSPDHPSVVELVEGCTEKSDPNRAKPSMLRQAPGNCSMRCSTSSIHAVEHERIGGQLLSGELFHRVSA